MILSGVTLLGTTVVDHPPVITTSLKQYYDIGNASSYSGAGTSVTDLAAGGYGTGTLVNTPTYTSAGNRSYLSLNGSNQYFWTPNLYTMVQGTLNVTLEAWVRTSADNGVVVDEQGNTPFFNGWHDAQIAIVSGALKGAVWPYTNIITGGSVTRNVWQQYALTYNHSSTTQTLYINGVSQGSSTITRSFDPSAAPNPGLWYAIGLGDITNIGDTSYLACDWSIFRVYNRALSTDEILQNYQAESCRYY
jgi:hypothetical protein